MKINKAKLKELLEKADGDEIELDGVFDQDTVNRIITDRLAKEKGKLTKYEQEKLELEEKLQQQQQAFETLKAEKANKGKTELELLQQEIEKRESQMKAWQEKATKAETEAKATYSRLKDDYTSRAVREVLLKGKAAPDRIAQAEMVFRAEMADALKLNEQDGRFSLGAIDPTLGTEKDITKLAEGWLGKNKHFAAPSPSGSGTPGAGTNPPPKGDKPFDPTGMGGLEAIEAALREEEKAKE